MAATEDARQIGAAANARESGNIKRKLRPSGSEDLEEVIVTAQKRAERLQDVPVPVTSISADVLVSSNQLRLQDYHTTVPGLDVTPVRPAYQNLSIRGITTGLFTNPTVGITVDDMPYGASTDLGGAAGVPDIDPFTLARVEVLRGPQGTLYGASSMGGLIKFVTVDPSTDGISGRVQVGSSSVHNGAELGYNFRGAANVPLDDTLAFRTSGFVRQDPGYIDNPVRHIDGVNKGKAYGGHFAALWRPSEVFSVKVNALLQKTETDGHPDVTVVPGLGDLQQNFVRGVGGNDLKVQAYSATLNAKLGSVDLTSISGYSVNAITDSVDYSFAFGSLMDQGIPALGFNGYGVSGAPLTFDNETKKFTQEFRLSAPIGERFEGLLGAFYTHEDSSYVQQVLAVDAETGMSAGTFLRGGLPRTYEEYAAFANLTYHVTERFDVQFGGRETQIKQSAKRAMSSGPYAALFAGGDPSITPPISTDASAFTYLVTPRFRVSSDLMVYARLASGYRAGGPNGPIAIALGAPLKQDPDKTQTYEIGAKGDFLDHTLSVDASLYYIDWKDLQLTLIDPVAGFSYGANGSSAKSQGVELSLESRPLDGLTVAAWVAYGDAELTEDLPPASTAYGVDGDRLPYSSRFSGYFSVDQEFSLTSSMTGFVGGSVSYIDDRSGQFGASAERQDLPAYTKGDLRAGVRYDSWTARLFVNNVTDKRGLLAGGVDAIPPYAFVYIQPRTVGVSIVKTF